MKYCNPYLAILFALILSGCSSDRVYRVDNLNQDIVKFDDQDKQLIVNFSNKYEKLKSIADSIDGVPVVLVQSMTYTDLLTKIKANIAKEEIKRVAFSLNIIKQITDLSQTVDTLSVEEISTPILVFSQRDLKLPNGLVLDIGRGFAQSMDKGKTVVVISKNLADKMNIGIGDKIFLDKWYTVIGILGQLEIIAPYNPTFFVFKTQF